MQEKVDSGFFSELSIEKSDGFTIVKQSSFRKTVELFFLLIKPMLLFFVFYAVAFSRNDILSDLYWEHFGGGQNGPENEWRYRGEVGGDFWDVIMNDILESLFGLILSPIWIVAIVASVFIVLRLPSGTMYFLPNRKILFRKGVMEWAGKSYELDSISFQTETKTTSHMGRGTIDSSGSVTIHSTGGTYTVPTGFLRIAPADSRARRIPIWIGTDESMALNLRKITRIAEDYR